MKIHFIKLVSCKKEAHRLRKKINTHNTKKQNAQVCLNIVANMYGWPSWNDLYVAHNKLTGQCLAHTLFIQDLTNLESIKLNQQKLNIVREFLTTVGITIHAQQQIVDTLYVLPSKAFDTKLTEHFIEHVVSIDALTTPMWRNNTLILDGNTDITSQIYSKSVGMQLVKDGGAVFLKEREALNLIDAIRHQLPSKDDARLRVISVANEQNDYVTHSVDLSKTETIASLGHYLYQVISVLSDNDSHSGWKGRAWETINSLCQSWTALYGTDAGALHRNGQHIKFDFDTLADVANNKCIDKRYKVGLQAHFNAIKSIRDCHGKLLNKAKQRPATIEQHQYVSMQCEGAISHASNKSTLPLCGISKIVDSDTINIFVLPNEKLNPHILKNNTSGLIYLLQLAISGARQRVLSNHKKHESTKVRILLIDADVVPLPKGFCALRGKSASWSYVVSLKGLIRGCNEIEINSSNSLMNNLIVVPNNDSAGITVINQHLPDELINLITQGHCVYTGSLGNSEKVWAKLV
jgi:hypothetical protein